MSRCYGCCQENCDTRPCRCSCHKPSYQALEDANVRAGQVIESAIAPVDLGSGDTVDRPGCAVHRRYKVKRPPRSACEACWRLWIARNP